MFIVVSIYGDADSFREGIRLFHLQNGAELYQFPILPLHLLEAQGQRVGVLHGGGVQGEQSVQMRRGELDGGDVGLGEVLHLQRPFCLFQPLVRGGEAEGACTLCRGKSQVEDALFLQDLLHSARPDTCVTIGQELSLMFAAVVYANGAVVQIGPHGFRHLVL